MAQIPGDITIIFHGYAILIRQVIQNQLPEILRVIADEIVDRGMLGSVDKLKQQEFDAHFLSTNKEDKE